MPLCDGRAGACNCGSRTVAQKREIQAALKTWRDGLVVTRTFGWSRTGVERRINDAINRLITHGDIRCSAEDTLTLTRDS